MVPDEYPSWATGWHNFQGYNIEVTQPLWNTPFEDGHYANLARVCGGYVRQGVPIRRIEYLPYSSNEGGFVQHQDTQQGIEAGKSDLGIMFDWGRFFAEVRNEVREGDMALTDEDRAWIREEIAVVRGKVEATYNEVRTQASAVATIVRNEVRAIPAGSGATPEEIKEALKDAQREGTG
jgi:hypothetical protein